MLRRVPDNSGGGCHLGKRVYFFLGGGSRSLHRQLVFCGGALRLCARFPGLLTKEQPCRHVSRVLPVGRNVGFAEQRSLVVGKPALWFFLFGPFVVMAPKGEPSFFFLLIFPFCPFVCLGPYLSWYLKGGQKETLAISRELQFRTVLLGEPHILTVAHRAERRSWRFPSRQRHARMQKELDSGKLPKK